MLHVAPFVRHRPNAGAAVPPVHDRRVAEIVEQGRSPSASAFVAMSSNSR